MIKALDVVYCHIGNREKTGGKNRYNLVVNVSEGIYGTTIEVAFGTSKHVSESGHLPHEFVVTDPRDLRDMGLKVPTAFNLKDRIRVPLSEIIDVTGTVPLDNRRLQSRLRKAVDAALEG